MAKDYCSVLRDHSEIPGGMGRILVKLFVFEQMFFIVHLYGCGTVASDLPPTHDPDPQFGGELADGRVALLMFCRERRMEFSTLRRATFSSMVMCHELHVEQANSVTRFIRCCRRCHIKTTTTFACTTCEVLTLRHPLLPYGYSYKASFDRPG